MDLRAYYQKIRKLEADLPGPFVVVVSRETSDGGRAGVMTEAPRGLAAKLIVDERASLASPEQTAEFHASVGRSVTAYGGAVEPTPSRGAKPQGKRQ